MKTLSSVSTLIILVSLTALSVISSCKQNSGNLTSTDSVSQNIIPPVIADTLSVSTKATPSKDSIGSRMTNSLLLPPIKSIKYLPIMTIFENIFPRSDSYPDSLFKFLKYYNKRFEDIGKYNVYYVQVSCARDFTAKCICKDDDYGSPSFGLLVLYDQNSMQANVINVSYDFSSESEHNEMTFSVNHNRIILYPSGQTEGEGGEAEELQGDGIIIVISKEGEIQIPKEL